MADDLHAGGPHRSYSVMLSRASCRPVAPPYPAVRYLQIFRKLEEAYDQMVHPQKRQDLKKALAATMGRILEIRNWMVDLNNGVDEVNLESALSDLKLRPEDLEVPVPRLFAEEQHVKMADKRKLMDAVLEQKGQAPVDASADPGAANVVLPLPSLDVVEALKVIKCNERGRQGRERFNAMRIDMRVHRAEEQRERDGQPPPSRHDAATQIQAVCRSFLARREVALMREEELEFLGMTLPLKHPGADEAHELEQRNVMKRKMTQRDNREEYEEALVVLRQRVKEMEGQDMRETIQDAVNAWFIDSRKPDGTYPDFPEEEGEGGRTESRSDGENVPRSH